jgi:hypothetical protein
MQDDDDVVRAAAVGEQEKNFHHPVPHRLPVFVATSFFSHIVYSFFFFSYSFSILSPSSPRAPLTLLLRRGSHVTRYRCTSPGCRTLGTVTWPVFAKSRSVPWKPVPAVGIYITVVILCARCTGGGEGGRCATGKNTVFGGFAKKLIIAKRNGIETKPCYRCPVVGERVLLCSPSRCYYKHYNVRLIYIVFGVRYCPRGYSTLAFVDGCAEADGRKEKPTGNHSESPARVTDGWWSDLLKYL